MCIYVYSIMIIMIIIVVIVISLLIIIKHNHNINNNDNIVGLYINIIQVLDLAQLKHASDPVMLGLASAPAMVYSRCMINDKFIISIAFYYYYHYYGLPENSSD